MNAGDPLNLVWEPSQWALLKVSFDGGATWQTALDLDADFDPANPQWNLVGAAFHVSNAWWQGQHLVADRVIPGRFYRFTWGQFMRSDDGGLTWRHGFNTWALGSSAPPAYAINTRLVPHPTRGGELWIASVPNSGNDPSQLYRSTDGGQTIAPVPGMLEATQVAFRAVLYRSQFRQSLPDSTTALRNGGNDSGTVQPRGRTCRLCSSALSPCRELTRESV